MIGKNCIQIFFQHTVTLIYTTTKLVSFLISSYGPHDRIKFKKTSCNQAWNIYLDTTCFKLLISIFIYTYLFVYLFISILLLYIVSIWLLLSVVVILYQGIFLVHGYMKSPQIPISTGDQLKRSYTKQVLKSHILCNYVSKKNSHEALPKSRCCSIITLSCFNKQIFVKEAIVCNARTCMLPQQYNVA